MKPKRFFIFLLMAVCWTIIPASASRLGDMRVHARFLTDRMAYELRLSNRQYNDVFEINFDFFYNVDPYIDRMSYGDPYALDMYYRYLDERNDDLRWVLSRRKYMRFMSLEHFFLPIYAVNRVCYVRIYNIYPDRTRFYYGRPSHYYSYNGGHCRHHHGGISFYRSHYKSNYRHSVYNGNYRSTRTQTRRRDFPEVNRPSLPGRGESGRHHSVRESSRTDRTNLGVGSSIRREHGSVSDRTSISNRPSRDTHVKNPVYTRPTRTETKKTEPSSIRTNRTEIRNTPASYRPPVRTESRRYESSSTRSSSRRENVDRRPSHRTTVRQHSTDTRSRNNSSHSERSERRGARER